MSLLDHERPAEVLSTPEQLENEPRLDAIRRSIIRESSLPAIAAEEFRFFAEGIGESFSAYFPLLTPTSTASRDYFLALIGAERPDEELHEDGEEVNRLLAGEGRVILEEQFTLGSLQEVIGAYYIGYRV